MNTQSTGKINLKEKPSSFVATGSIQLWSCGVHEFFNECHGQSDGKFCSTPGGGKGESKGETNEEEKKETKDEKEERKQYKKDTKKAIEIGKKHLGAEHQLSTKQAQKDKEVNWANIGLYTIGTVAYLEFAGISITSMVGSQTIGRYRAKRAAAKLSGKIVSKGIHSIRGKNGKTLHLVNHSDNLTNKQRDSLLKGFKLTYDNDPLPGPPPKLIIWERHGDPRETLYQANGFYWFGKQPPDREIHINRANIYNFERTANFQGIMPYGGRRWSMTSRKKDLSRYVVAHEYGHMKDNFQEEASVNAGEASFLHGNKHSDNRMRMWTSPDTEGSHPLLRGNGMSMYGKTNEYEGYAESYAEWSVTNGSTKNKASVAYAKTFKWEINKNSSIPMGPTGSSSSGRAVAEGVSPRKRVKAPSIDITSPGERIVRTPEGARRYGVSIGQPIPEEVESSLLNAFEFGSKTATIVLTPKKVENVNN